METDEALYLRVRQGDILAFDELYARYAPRLYGFLASLLRSRADAEDVFHDSFMRALEAENVELYAGAFRGWLFRIARNRALNVIRGKERGARAAEAVPAPDPPTTADDRIAERQADAALAFAVARLPPALSEVFHLRASGMSYDEMASVLEIPLGTIKSRMNQMVTTLREEMRPWTAR
jgi:RNA polymerase sigma-70 factor (ECF subfamily)